MAEAGALLGAILAGHVDGETEALLHLESALELEVDPLDYCATRFGLGQEAVMERAARWADLAFAPRVPGTRPGSAVIERIERLGEVRTIRASLLDREVIYCAPRFSDVLALRRHARRHPDFRRGFCMVPEAAIRSELAAASEEQLLTEARHRLFRRWPRASAHLDLTIASRFGFVAGMCGLLLLAVLAPMVAKPVFVPLIGALLAIPGLFRLWAALDRRPDKPEPPLLDDADLPVYTVLLPLRDEAHMVPQLAHAIRELDYPPEKLKALFLVEQRSPETVAAVYDAEDIPEPGQLRRAASTFAQRPSIACLQAELVVDNAHENWLMALFAGEYAGQFGLMLPLLARLGLPMPLGGTSNHFRTAALREIGGWDPFNVTEDADLGVRLARRGMTTETFDSRTSEEAPVRFASWLMQRTRWMKGWMRLPKEKLRLRHNAMMYRVFLPSRPQRFR